MAVPNIESPHNLPILLLSIATDGITFEPDSELWSAKGGAGWRRDQCQETLRKHTGDSFTTLGWWPDFLRCSDFGIPYKGGAMDSGERHSFLGDET